MGKINVTLVFSVLRGLMAVKNGKDAFSASELENEVINKYVSYLYLCCRNLLFYEEN